MRREGTARLAIALLASWLLLLGIDNADRPLAHPDEGRYSEISREMAASGDWVTPRLNGIKYLEKPPLQYWASAAAFRAFGPAEFAARLYVNACALLTLALVGYAGSRLGPPGTGRAAMLVLAASPYFLALGGAVTLDMGLTLWTTATFCALALAQAAPDARGRRRWLLAAWAAMALAVLSKGLVGLLLPAAAVVLHALSRRDLTPLFRLEWGYGPIVFLALAAPWFAAVSSRNPEFAQFFFVHEHLQRFLTTRHGREEPWWYFLPILALGFLPWMLALPAALAHGWRAERGALDGAQPLRLAILWSAFALAFFSASGSKLPTYILPAFPPLALVLGRYLAEAPPHRLAGWVAPVAGVAVVLAAVAWASPDHAREEWTRALYLEARPYALAAAGVLLAFLALGASLLRTGRRWAGIALVAVGVVGMVDFLEEGYERLAPRQSGRALAATLQAHAGPDARLYSVRIYDQTLPFYLRRTLTLVDYTDEFATGLRAEPARSIARLEDFPAAWREPGEAVAIMHPDTYPELRAQGLPMQVLHEDPRRVLVRKP